MTSFKHGKGDQETLTHYVDKSYSKDSMFRTWWWL